MSQCVVYQLRLQCCGITTSSVTLAKQIQPEKSQEYQRSNSTSVQAHETAKGKSQHGVGHQVLHYTFHTAGKNKPNSRNFILDFFFFNNQAVLSIPKAKGLVFQRVNLPEREPNNISAAKRDLSCFYHQYFTPSFEDLSDGRTTCCSCSLPMNCQVWIHALEALTGNLMYEITALVPSQFGI